MKSQSLLPFPPANNRPMPERRRPLGLLVDYAPKNTTYDQGQMSLKVPSDR